MNIDQQIIIGESPAFLEIIEQTSSAARHNRPVLVIGERGTGKELIASRLHFLSPRWEQNFVQVNCAALPENLLEAELFGHEAGAFTGSQGKRIGRFEEAHKGTLFLDEIATTSLSAQEKILRVTEYGTFQRLGSNKTLHTDVRIIGATNVDLPSLADMGDFRHDLLDRLALDVITLPPLRHRKEDIIILSFHFGQKIAQEIGWESFPGFSHDLIDELMSYEWPGNIRELKNVIERAVYYASNEFEPVNQIMLDPFASPYRPKRKIMETVEKEHEDGLYNKPDVLEGPVDFNESIENFEKSLLINALKQNKFNQKNAAKFLNLNYHQLRHQLKKHNIS
ncbi:phage shock protein operon transcriptional activator [Pseudemcibacter aquimaris]|uniref:phage shock protein operon transcriptional activator n=1 Tax=Pseudemcibacter aquimaris TaxID=2857064 RepID=UPI0020135919|nr:phage shock protein operon transcriptional activator [Pseudemcibacter aquimaris]MCC3861675.1 phage shock protein operon transcriptional activator [Pseudemcibacter aquimaris]WDU58446.1 phage shock protein operon transcriptional activator [Pseudemcibacter aquimaris]